MDMHSEKYQKPNIDETFRVLHEKAHEFISDQHEFLQQDHGFGDFDRYTLDLENSIISFFKQEQTTLRMTYQIVGSLEDQNSLWRWRWADPLANETEIKELEIIKNYGDFYDFNYLTLSSWNSSTQEAWALTVISAYLRTAKGIFKLQQAEQSYFIYFKEVLS